MDNERLRRQRTLEGNAVTFDSKHLIVAVKPNGDIVTDIEGTHSSRGFEGPNKELFIKYDDAVLVYAAGTIVLAEDGKDPVFIGRDGIPRRPAKEF